MEKAAAQRLEDRSEWRSNASEARMSINADHPVRKPRTGLQQKRVILFSSHTCRSQ